MRTSRSDGDQGRADAARLDWLEPYRWVVAELMGRRGLGNTEVARSICVSRQYLGRIRAGERPVTQQILNDLILYLDIDRGRLALAVEVMGDARLYFDPTFRNACYAARTVLSDAMALAETPGASVNRAIVFAAFSRERCEDFAHRAMRQLSDQFAKIEVDGELSAAA